MCTRRHTHTVYYYSALEKGRSCPFHMDEPGDTVLNKISQTRKDESQMIASVCNLKRWNPQKQSVEKWLPRSGKGRTRRCWERRKNKFWRPVMQHVTGRPVHLEFAEQRS